MKQQRFLAIIGCIVFAVILLIPVFSTSYSSSLDDVRTEFSELYEEGILIHTENTDGRYYDFLAVRDDLHVVCIRSKDTLTGEIYKYGSDYTYSYIENFVQENVAHYQETKSLNFKEESTMEQALHSASKTIAWCFMDASQISVEEDVTAHPFSHNGKEYVLYIKVEENGAMKEAVILDVQIGTVTVHLLPLIIYAGILFALFLCLILAKARAREIPKLFLAEKYSEVIKKAPALLKRYERFNKKFPSDKLTFSIESLHLLVAISCFAMAENKHFLEHIHCVAKNTDVKEMWLSLFYWQQDDLEQAKTHYDQISCNEVMQLSKRFLQAMFLYKQNEQKAAKEAMRDIYPQLKQPLLKKLAREILS